MLTEVLHRLAEKNLLRAEPGLMMVPNTRPPSFVPRLGMRDLGKGEQRAGALSKVD